MNPGPFGVPWAFWGVGALVLAALFAAWAPNATRLEGLGRGRRVVLRWFHALTWALLGVSFLGRGFSVISDAAADLIALAGLATYGVYVVTLAKSRAERP